LIEHAKRIQPFSASDGEYVTLVEFTIQAAQLLDPAFEPQDSWSERVTESDSIEDEIVSFYYGREPTIVKIVYRKRHEPKTHGHIEDDVTVICDGLHESMRIELQVLRCHTDPRFIELRIAGPERPVNIILEGFEKRFNINHIPEEREVEYTLQNARAAVRVHAWRIAELNAQKALSYEPYNPDAIMYLGIAKAAQGYEPEGENLLLASLTLNPRSIDAYYNLGLIVLNQGRCILASEAFIKGLSIEPTYHPLHYQLGRALERHGDLKQSIEAYQWALKHKPNPEQIWEYSGKDFTAATIESIARVSEAIQANQNSSEEQSSEQSRVG